MPVGSRPDRDAPPEATPRVDAYESRPGQLVFIEEGNPDAWIATDGAVEPEP